MKDKDALGFIRIDEYSATPKYLQLANSIVAAIEKGDMREGDLLPSINEVSARFDIGRDTVNKSYRHLREMGTIRSWPGKGYGVSGVAVRQKPRVFLLFNKLSAHKKVIYDAFTVTLGPEVPVDFYIYHNEYGLFRRLLEDRREPYTHYVIIPHFMADADRATELIDRLPKDRLLLLDKDIPNVSGNYSVVCEDFERDIYEALTAAKGDLSRYHTLKLIFPAGSYYPKEIVQGFSRFCDAHGFRNELSSNVATVPIQKGEAFIVAVEDDLVSLLERITESGLIVGEDTGVLSYNETRIKKILLNGISTISTDFAYMGRAAAELVLSGRQDRLSVPFFYTKRTSL